MQKFSRFLAIMIAVMLVFTVTQSLNLEPKAAISTYNGTVATSFASGTGTADDPFIIKTAAEFAYFAQKANTNSNYFSRKYVKLEADIRLNDETFTFDADTGLVKVTGGGYTGYLGTGILGDTSGTNAVFDTTASSVGVWYASNTSTTEGAYKGSLYEWTPIANFTANFDGNGHTISGLYVNPNNADYGGLFGYTFNTATFKNITVDKSLVGGKSSTGAIVGSFVYGSEGTPVISNCHNKGIILSTMQSSYSGGIFGRTIGCAAKILNCSNSGTILLNGFGGGIAGCVVSNSNVEGCSNSGLFYSAVDEYNYIGGIVSYATNTNILNCSNSANITFKLDNRIGGIVSQFTAIDNYIAGCTNTGNITTIDGAGSVAGIAYSVDVSSVAITTPSLRVFDCHNKGNLSSQSVGGILEYVHNSSDDKYPILIYDCTNSGTLSGRYISGISASSSLDFVDILNCHNTGNMTAEQSAYGITSGANLIKDCTNSGNLTSSFLSYGIGYAKTISYCSNTGNITVGDSGAGIGRGDISCCYNKGNIISTSNANPYVYLGGIAANASTTTIKYSYNTGNIKIPSNKQGYLSGIAVECDTIYACYNAGSISGGKGIASGISNTANSIKESYNVGTVTAGFGAGAITYRTSKPIFSYCYYLEGCAILNGVPQNAMSSNVSGYTPEPDPSGCFSYPESVIKNRVFDGFSHGLWELGVVEGYDYPTLTVFNHTETSSPTGSASSWSFNENTKTLTVSTTLTNVVAVNYNITYTLPWSHLSDKIENVVLSGDYMVPYEFCFANLPNLKTVVLSDSVKVISRYMFYKCTSLTQITLPTSLEIVGVFGFYGCDNLETVYYYVPSAEKEKIEIKSPNSELLAAKWINPNEHNYQTVVTAPTCTEQGYTTFTCVDCNDSYIADYIAATGHNYISSVTPPTCTALGYTTHTCSGCDKSYKDTYISATGHSYGAWTTVTEPTCTTKGSEKRVCSICNYEQFATIQTVPHNYTEVVVPPTCTEQGYTQHNCTMCGNTYTDTYTDIIAHTFGDWEIVINATCTSNGTKKHICSVCSCIVTETIPALGHNYTSTTIAPTCNTYGYTLYTCTACGDEYTENYTSPISHKYGEWYIYKQPTCTATGIKKKTCSVCGNTQSQTIAKTDHSFGNWVIISEPTETEDGIKRRTCSGCNTTETVYYTGEHTFGEWKIITDATCTTEGTKQRICIDCGKIETQVITSGGHANTEWILEYYPNCMEYGYERLICTDCWETLDTRTLPKTDHYYDVWVYEPSCTTEGYTHHYCMNCGYSYTDNYTEPTGHEFGEWEIYDEPTCENEGTEHRYCTNFNHEMGYKCEAHEERPVSALDHSFGDWEIITNATCTEEGERKHVCNLCKKEETEVISKIAHTPCDWWDYEMYPSCEQEGTEVLRCYDCSEILDSRSVPATGHYYDVFVREPSCTTEGYTHHYCMNCGHSYTDNYTEPTGHEFGEWYVYDEPNCEKEGIERRYCIHFNYEYYGDCYEYEERILSSTGHTFGDWEIVTNATCTEKGEHKHTCNICDKEVTEIIPAKGHTEGEWVTAFYPTCRETGTENCLCADCGEILDSRTLPKAEHVPNYWWELEMYPSCEQEGTEVLRCYDCWEILDSRSVPATGHYYDVFVREPSCTTEGYTHHYCMNCGYSYTDNYTEPTGHNFGEWEIYDEPTCENEGTEHRYCTNFNHEMGYECEAHEERPVSALDHSFGDWEIITNATCTEEGERKHVCNLCKKEETEVISKIAHTPCDWWDYEMYPSCEQEGTEVLRCYDCSEILDSRSVPATGHYYDVFVREPSCTTEGYTHHYCMNCGYSYTDNYTEPTGHEFGEWYVYIEPDYENDGVERRHCIHFNYEFYEECYEYEERIIPKFSTVSGGCGESTNWEFDLDNGQFSISGNGVMTEYESNQDAPWRYHNENIKTIIIEKEVTAISKSALSGYIGVTFYIDYSAEYKEIIEELASENSGYYAIFGDMNNDKSLNAFDMVDMINVVLGSTETNDKIASDITRDNKTNLLDLVRLKKALSDIGGSNGDSGSGNPGGIPVAPIIPGGSIIVQSTVADTRQNFAE